VLEWLSDKYELLLFLTATYGDIKFSGRGDGSIVGKPVVLSSEFLSLLMPACRHIPNFARVAEGRTCATTGPRLVIIPKLPLIDISSLVMAHHEAGRSIANFVPRLILKLVQDYHALCTRLLIRVLVIITLVLPSKVRVD
jgi:hypothetical protein